MKSQGVECPECGGLLTKVSQSNLDVEGNRVRTRRCQDCDHQFGTVEVALPGLSFPRTQRTRNPMRVAVPQHVSVKQDGKTVVLKVIAPKYANTCRKGHPWTPENIYRPPRTGRRTCRQCRLENARERYHNARRKAPESIKEEQRKRWREAYRRRSA